MTCQHCQTWILDDEHRCHRCGRRVRSTPSRISPNTYPIAAAATARAYDFETDTNSEPVARSAKVEPQKVEPQAAPKEGQQTLFPNATFEPRIIPFDSLTTKAERESIRARAAELSRPAPLKTAKVELKRARPRKNGSADQRRLDFQGQEEVLTQPQSNIICDAPVAPVALRMEAALIDSVLMVAGWLMAAALFIWQGGQISLDKHVAPFLALAAMTVPLFYKVVWSFAGRDTVGMRCAGLRLVDFDGNPPSEARRQQRLVGSILSLLAGGLGLLWAMFDEDGLTWHDHISSTFPTIAGDR